MDVHQVTVSVAVMDSGGKIVMESLIETKSVTILGFIQGLRGTLWVTFEEGTSATWLYELLPHVGHGGGLRSAEECFTQSGQV